MALLLLLLAVGLVLMLAGALIRYVIVPFVGAGVEAIEAIPGLLGSSDLIYVSLEPVERYLTSHASGLSLSPDELKAVWISSGVLFFILACVGSTGARIGWVIFGVLSTGMVWAATPQPSEWIGAGLTMTLWALLSIFAFGRIRTRQRLFGA